MMSENATTPDPGQTPAENVPAGTVTQSPAPPLTAEEALKYLDAIIERNVDTHGQFTRDIIAQLRQDFVDKRQNNLRNQLDARGIAKGADLVRAGHTNELVTHLSPTDAHFLLSLEDRITGMFSTMTATVCCIRKANGCGNILNCSEHLTKVDDQEGK